MLPNVSGLLADEKSTLCQKFTLDIQDELRRLHAECARKEAERVGIRNREEQLAQELEQLTDSSNLCQSPQAVRENSGYRIAPAVVVRVTVASEPLLEPAASAITAASDDVPTAKEEEPFEEIIIVAASNDAVAEAKAEWSHTSTRDGFEEEAPEDYELLQPQVAPMPARPPNASEAQPPLVGRTHKPENVQPKKMSKCRKIGVTEFRQHIKAFNGRMYFRQKMAFRQTVGS